MVKNKGMNKILIFSMIFLMFGNCCKDNSLFKDDELSISRQDYNGDQLRLDGYYYTEANGLVFLPSFFYTNGVLLSVGGTFDDISDMDSYLNRYFFQDENSREDIWAWGAFIIDNNSIKFEKWYPPSGGPIPAYVNEGLILNDTTFYINQSYRNHNGKKKEQSPESRTYHFRAFSPKPDSINKYVK